MKFSLRVSGIDDVQRSLHRYSADVSKKLQKEVAHTATRIHADATYDAAVDTGFLRKGIRFTIGRMAAIVWSSAKHSLDVEKGQNPGRWPDPQALSGWVRRKLGITGKRNRSVTFLVGRKIYTKGTEAQPFFEPAVMKYKNKFFSNTRRIILNSKL